MSNTTAIQWTEATWNPWHGCLKVSTGCKNCYMYSEKKRYGQDPSKVVRSKSTFNDPLKWVRAAERKGFKLPRFVFTCSWSDFFISEADAWRAEAWEIIRQTPQIVYQILTKRPERIRQCLPPDWGDGYPNVWLGVSVENQQYANERIPLLLQTPAAVRWISAEPLLGPIEVQAFMQPSFTVCGVTDDARLATLSSLARAAYKQQGGSLLDWVVCGGESGPGARPMEAEWARSLRDQCHRAGVPFFFKQWGEWLPSCQDGDPQGRGDQILNASNDAIRVGKKAAGRLLDGREWNEYPAAINSKSCEVSA